MSDLRIGILGAARVASYALIKPAESLDGVQVVAVAAREAERARAYAGEHGIGRAYGDYRSLFGDRDVDLVYIATPPSVHVEQALEAVAAGKPVLVEKPFAVTASDARRVHEASLKTGVPVFEAMHSLHHALFARILDIIGSGEIGRLQRMEAWFEAPIDPVDPLRWSAALGGGALMDLGVYPLAWIRRIAGEHFEVLGAEAEFRSGVDARFTADVQYPSGLACTVGASMVADKPAARLRISGTCGELLAVNPLAPQLGHVLMVQTELSRRSEQVNGASSYEAQLGAVRNALQGHKAFPLPNDDYVRSMAAIERVRAALLH